MEHLSNDHEDCPNQHKNSLKLCSEMEHPVVSLTKSQCKLRKQHDQNFPNGKKATAEQILASEERNPNEQIFESHSQGSEQQI